MDQKNIFSRYKISIIHKLILYDQLEKYLRALHEKNIDAPKIASYDMRNAWAIFHSNQTLQQIFVYLMILLLILLA